MRIGPALLLSLALVPSAWLAWKARDAPHLGYFHDDGLYWVCAKSLAEGGGYRIESLPGSPAQTKYPPLYPLLLAGVWKAAPRFPANLPAAVALSWLALAAFLPLVRAALVDLGVRGAAAWGLTAALALSPYYALCGFSLLSELPFACLFLSALLLLTRARSPGMAALAGVAASAAFLTRSAGLVLLAGAAAAFLPRRQWRQAAAFAAAMLPSLLGWTLWTHAHRAVSTDTMTLFYTDYLGFWAREVSATGLPLVLWTNLDSLLSAIGGMVIFGLPDSLAGKTIARLLAVAALVGLARLWRRSRAAPYLWTTAGYLAVLLAWNYPPDQRFLTPVFPVLLAGLYAELRRLATRLRAAFSSGGAADRAVAAALAALLAAAGAAAVAGALAGLFVALPRFLDEQRAHLAQRRPAYDWIASHTPSDAAALAYFDTELYLYSGRKACFFVIPSGLAYAGDKAASERYYSSVVTYARAHQLTYIVLTPHDLHAELPEPERGSALAEIRRAMGPRALYESDGISVQVVR